MECFIKNLKGVANNPELEKFGIIVAEQRNAVQYPFNISGIEGNSVKAYCSYKDANNNTYSLSGVISTGTQLQGTAPYVFNWDKYQTEIICGYGNKINLENLGICTQLKVLSIGVKDSYASDITAQPIGDISSLSSLTNLATLAVPYCTEITGSVKDLLDALWENGQRGTLNFRGGGNTKLVYSTEVSTLANFYWHVISFDENGWSIQS